MDLLITPIKKIEGEITAPPSKSYSHRAFIAASLANGVSVIKNPLTHGDVSVTLDILKELGVKVLKTSDNSYAVEREKPAFKSVYKTINCGNSGTSIRIFSALSLLIEGGLSFSGEFLKRNRPILPLLDALKKLGGDYKLIKDSLHVERKQKFCDHVVIPGDISSQFITALLFLCPIISCNNTEYIEITTSTPLVSYPYIEITLDVLKAFGLNIQSKITENGHGTFLMSIKQHPRPQMYHVPGDFSSIAFLLAATVISPENSELTIKNLNMNNPQGDKRIIEILKAMGADLEISESEKSLTIRGNVSSRPLTGTEVDCSEIPDLFPILAVLGSYAKGKTILHDASNLRLKESDRISVMARELTKMGVKVEEHEDKLIVYHCDRLTGITINHENDHRIAMALTIAALYAEGSSKLNNPEVINDSYPDFIQDLKKVNAEVEIK